MGKTKVIECVIPILPVKDLAASLAHYTQVLGFSKEWAMDDIASVERDGFSLYLSKTEEERAGISVWVGVDDFDKIYAEYVASGADIVMPPTNYPWAYEMHVKDLDGNIMRIGGEPRQQTDE